MPSSLTEDRSSTLGSLPLPTCVGVRYGLCGLPASSCEKTAARGFSGRPGHHTTTRASAAPPVTPANCPAAKVRICLDLVPRGNTAPCPFGAGVLPVASPPRVPCTHKCRNLLPARHRLRPLTLRDLGLGSDSPWDDCRCPGTLRLPVWRVLTPPFTLLIPAFSLVGAPSGPSGPPSPLPTTLPYHDAQLPEKERHPRLREAA